MPEARHDLVRNRVPDRRPARQRDAGLDDVAGDDAVEHRAVEERHPRRQRLVVGRPFGEGDEVGDGHRRPLHLEPETINPLLVASSA